MIFDKLCEIDLEIEEIDADSEFDVEYEPVPEGEYEYEHEREHECEHECEHAHEHEHEHAHEHAHEHEHEYEREHEREHEHEYERVLQRTFDVEAGLDRRAERSDGETGTTPPVLGSSRSRSGTEAWTRENPGGTGSRLLKRSEGREAPQVAGREMKNPGAARMACLRSTGSDDPTGGHDV